MRIAVDARPLSMPLTGIGRYTHSILSEMTKMDHEWCLYSDSVMATRLASLANVTVRHGSTQASSARGLYYSQGVFRSWLKKDNPDVFWSPRHHLPLWMDSGIPRVLTIHDMVWKRFPETMPWQARALERMLMPTSIKQANRIICVSQFTASELAYFWPDQVQKCEIIPLAAMECCDGDQRARLEQQPYILFVGTLEPRKNLRRLLQAFSKLVNARSIKENLVIVGGKGWGGSDLAALLRNLKIEDRVVLAGYVNDSQLQQLYLGARCLVLPSLYEGFGLPVLEAMQFGVPAIVSDAGALPEVTGDAALFIDPQSVNSIARTIEMLMQDQGLHARLSMQGKKRAGEFSWQRAARSTIDVFNSVVNSPP